jgi:mannose/cellobiose epimerase-like protein (N-acyl-D-glucosamine 2-epimerase family)
MAIDYMHYKPMLLDKPSLEVLKSQEYRRFIHQAAIVPGIRLYLHRHRRRPDWPYVDTKFNPNTGRDLPDSSYRVVYTWFLGRGGEALQAHLARLDQFEELSQSERNEARDVFSLLSDNITTAIVKITDRNSGRCPFRVNRDFLAIDENGQRVEADPGTSSAGDTFCAKGLIATGREAHVRQGFFMLQRTVEHIRQNKYGVDQFKEQPKDIGQGARMLTLGATALLFGATRDAALRAGMLQIAEEFIGHVLDKHYDAESGVFSEYIDADTGARKTYLDPGHANEFVGLGLGAAACMRQDNKTLSPARQRLLEKLYAEMPRLLIESTELGWNPRYPGLFKAVDTKTRQPINDDLPWWNLPETMRAAAHAFAVSRDLATRDRCLNLIRICHNAYFKSYPNPSNMLFAFQTISGATGKVLDKAPAVPEGDPLYHTNLALLEMLDILETL